MRTEFPGRRERRCLLLDHQAGLPALRAPLKPGGLYDWPYVVERFLPPGGIVTLTPGTVLAELPEPPLQVVLVMAGLDTVGYRVPWLDREIVVTHGTT